LENSFNAGAFAAAAGDELPGLESVEGAHILAESDAQPLVELPATSSGRFAIRTADTHGRRSHASYLIHKMYGWRGYSSAPLPDDPNRLTLIAYDDDRAVATITVGIDSPAGMSVESLYPQEINELRGSGAILCEFTRFAIDRTENSLDLLAMMFHVAYLFARRRFGASHLLAEVNPRHVLFYRRMLGFKAHGPERICPRVGAPAVLLMLPLDWGEEQVARYGGRRELTKSMRSLYPYFFSPKEEAALLRRLLSPEALAAT
jgi:hypothetical protein